MRNASEVLRFEERVSCHALHKAFRYRAWKSGVSPVVIMDMYNHSSLAVTQRCLGVTQDGRKSVYLGLNHTALRYPDIFTIFRIGIC